MAFSRPPVILYYLLLLVVLLGATAPMVMHWTGANEYTDEKTFEAGVGSLSLEVTVHYRRDGGCDWHPTTTETFPDKGQSLDYLPLNRLENSCDLPSLKEAIKEFFREKGILKKWEAVIDKLH